MFRTALIRYGIPTLLAISAVAYFDVPMSTACYPIGFAPMWIFAHNK